MSEFFTIAVLHVPSGEVASTKLYPRDQALDSMATWMRGMMDSFNCGLDTFRVYKDGTLTTPHDLQVVKDLLDRL